VRQPSKRFGGRREAQEGEEMSEKLREEMAIVWEQGYQSGRREALETLGITPDQLRIARALDREKISLIREGLTHLYLPGLYRPTMDEFEALLALLPTFDEEKANENAVS